MFPYGEWVILFLALATWVEKGASRRLFFLLTLAWMIGKYFEVVYPPALPWNWHYARLATILVFWGWALQRTERKQRILPLVVTSTVLSLETLFLVNEPGVIPYSPWVFTIVLILVAKLTGKSYWGTAAAFAGSILLNQAFMRFTYEGIVRYADFPDPFVWNFGVGLFAIWAGLRLGYASYSVRKEAAVKPLIPSNAVGVYNPSDERELQ